MIAPFEKYSKTVSILFRRSFFPGLEVVYPVLSARHAACTLQVKAKGGDYVVRLFDTCYHPQTWIEEEIRVLGQFQSQNPKAPVPKLWKVQQFEVYQGLLLEYVPGRHPEFSSSDYAQLGQGLGQLHRLSQQFSSSPAISWGFGRFWNTVYQEKLARLLTLEECFRLEKLHWLFTDWPPGLWEQEMGKARQFVGKVGEKLERILEEV